MIKLCKPVSQPKGSEKHISVTTRAVSMILLTEYMQNMKELTRSVYREICKHSITKAENSLAKIRLSEQIYLTT